MGSLLWMSQRMVVLSSHTEARVCPSAEKALERIISACACSADGQPLRSRPQTDRSQPAFPSQHFLNLIRSGVDIQYTDLVWLISHPLEPEQFTIIDLTVQDADDAAKPAQQPAEGLPDGSAVVEKHAHAGASGVELEQDHVAGVFKSIMLRQVCVDRQIDETDGVLFYQFFIGRAAVVFFPVAVLQIFEDGRILVEINRGGELEFGLIVAGFVFLTPAAHQGEHQVMVGEMDRGGGHPFSITDL